MPGSATYTRDADVASLARERLDRTAEAVRGMAEAQRAVLAELVGLWPTSAWLAAGASSAKAWLLAYTDLGHRDALRLERIATLCVRHGGLAEAVLCGELSLRRAEVLGRVVTDERSRYLADSLPALLRLNTDTSDEAAFEAAVRYWADQVDQELAPRRVQPHSLVLSPRLFGGGTLGIDDTDQWIAIDAHGTTWTGRPTRGAQPADPAGSHRRRRPTHQTSP